MRNKVFDTGTPGKGFSVGLRRRISGIQAKSLLPQPIGFAPRSASAIDSVLR